MLGIGSDSRMISRDYRARAKISLKNRWLNTSASVFIYNMIMGIVSSISAVVVWLMLFGMIGKTFEEIIEETVKEYPYMKADFDKLMKDDTYKQAIKFLDHLVGSISDLLPTLALIAIISFILYLVLNSMLSFGLYKTYLDAARMKEAMDCIKEAQIPVVLSNVIYEEEDIPSVAIDYETATYEITKRMMASGRKDIYMFSTVRRYSINNKKVAGYVNAMTEAGLEPKILRTSGDVSINRLHFEEFIKNNNVDGVLAVRDSIAISFMNVAIAHNKKVPEELGIVGLQNTKYAILARPNLTCVDTPVYDIGAVSMRLLTKYMKQEEVKDNKILLPYRIIERGSTTKE